MPFAAGTEVELGPKGLHADNMNSVAGAEAAITFTGQASVPASIDLWVPAGTVVHPVAAGTVVSAFSSCDVVLIAHATGEWSEYLHVDVAQGLSAGEAVTPETVLGTVLPAPATACGQFGDAEDHLHFALARPADSTGATAKWIEMAGHAFCGKEVDADGAGDIAWGDTFAVPEGCGVAGTASVTPTPTPTPTPAPTPTPTPVPVPVLAASWSAPKDGAKVTSSTLKLTAKASFSPATISVSKVVFTVKWGSTTKKACSDTTAGAGGTWSCKVDLWKIGAPLGRLKISFDVTDSAGTVARSPDGKRTVTFSALPPRPKVTSRTGPVVGCSYDPTVVACSWITYTWPASPDETAKIEIYHLWSGIVATCKKTFQDFIARPSWYAMVAAKPGTTRVREELSLQDAGGGDDCGSYARAVNRFGASGFVRVIER